MNQNLALRAFMCHLNRAIQTKTGAKNAWLSRKIYGEIIAFAHDYPQLLGALSVAIDKLPNPCDPATLLILTRCRRDELLSDARAQARFRRSRNVQDVGSLAHRVLTAAT